MQAHSPTKVEESREDWGLRPFRHKLRFLALASFFLASWAVMVFGTGCSFLIRQGPSDLRFVQVNLANFGGTTSGTTTGLGPKVLVVTLAIAIWRPILTRRGRFLTSMRVFVLAIQQS